MKYSLGLDFGTESARAVLLDVQNGREAASAEFSYPHGVIVPRKDWALQDPQDWLDALRHLSRAILKKSKANPSQIIGIGIDFTSCTVLPTTEDGTPLCKIPKFKKDPHAWPKLWKHHGAWKEAEEMTAKAEKMGERFIRRYGGKISSEWLIPKLLEVLRGSNQAGKTMDKFIEAQDWTVWRLTGQMRRSACGAGYKGSWSKREGFPSAEYLDALHPGLSRILEEKVGRDFYAPGTRAGTLTKSQARTTGLAEGTPVAVSIIDAHASVLGAGVSRPGEMVLCMGTSTCHLLLDGRGREVPGISGVAEGGILPGLFGYEAGQAAVGDMFGWFTKTSQMKFADLEKGAAKLKAGQNGLLALDWWNGNRSVLQDAGLSGMILGLTLHTTPHEIYRALIEATAMGTRRIIEQFESSGIPVKKMTAVGGIAEKSPFLLQIYADVCRRPVELVEAANLCARGAAVLGVLARDPAAVRRMAPVKRKVFNPKREDAEIYGKIYREYLRVHDYFGRGENPVMRKLRHSGGPGSS
ncbi:MAG: ribulokinase [Elusimicrobia bacterium RIFCSPLOWO2_01_FULL_60_11]|nr:MAG: ribulokinase [Elusimicrobia bacterium RIFCSPLOWO2_01_FULL_60_11]